MRQNSCRLDRTALGAAKKDEHGPIRASIQRQGPLARLLAPESAALHVVAQDLGVRVSTLERWREQARSKPARGPS